jgi:iron complex outermembrane receptor protein
LQVGYPIGVFWIPQHAGFDNAGNELFYNYQNGKLIGTSPSYSDQDRVYIDPTPHYTWGLTNNFSYKNFDLSFFLRGVQGQKIFANSLMILGASVYLPGSNVTVKSLSAPFTSQPQPSTYWLRDGSYTRLENLTIGYNFKNIKGINMLRYVTATNLFVITNYED